MWSRRPESAFLSALKLRCFLGLLNDAMLVNNDRDYQVMMFPLAEVIVGTILMRHLLASNSGR